MAEVTITKENFEALVLQSEKPVLLDFWAVWCGPCQMLAPTIEEISRQREDILVGKVNVDDQYDLAVRFGIESIPTVLAFKDGQVTGRSIGFVSKEQILALL
jgi:thioredoxin 1